MTSSRLGLLLIVALAIGWAHGEARVWGAPASERALTKKEVVDLYEGKSWLWEKGVGFFATKSQFNAFSGEGKDRSTAAGSWEALDDGRLCFSGVWTTKAWRRFARTCFAHKIKDGQIYQRRLPKGEWYIFRHDPEQEGDQKLVTGDQTR
jgi:UDPglucose 6-dehydrogenase